ncbi:aminopeptidase N [Methylobacterium symbioticum]|uniref:Aminopeptidase N n=1 Tax=Methylobacterium symbioticum TaxID=2584084 RepID=A0A509E902_9HYPH|nr:aminopeptidase N [Methylobacterium symbioticum]VUD70588.1 Aminopeptidase N [Methylobacterium symbioticum]
MRTETPPLIHLAEYRPSDFLIDRVDLDVRLHPSRTRVTAMLALRPNPAGDPTAPLRLDGDELALVALALDGQPLPEDAYAVSPSGLVLSAPPRRPFTLAIVTELDPGANTKLMGLYRSGAVYCTQCEADGFRRITYFLDRPDVLSVYTTRIEADRDEAPVLLGNGNPVEAGALDGNRHYAVWHDPHPKPAYLFALVGGRLGHVATRFTTMEGRDVAVAVHVEPGKEARAAYALDAVVRSMRWDEEAFGRPYDLDVFNVVAVSDFNMGAMENKGLNIFNDKYVLASPETATDADYAAIEAIIAHEYFHNWSGNRVTCRDWFQLCLKEGLTVFRDQEFSSDMRSRAVHRIAEVRQLRARQFPEDAGPLRHPVRPTAYAEINNFYTATVYEKGAEIVRMLKTLLGPDAFRAGMDRYFAENDGRAATVEDFLDAFASVSGRDLAAFAQWYARPGTPRLAFRTAYDPAARTCDLTLSQSLDGGPPLVMPVALGLVGPGGALDADCPDLADGVYVLTDREATLRFRGVTERPVPSLLRGFSAPVRLDGALTEADHLVLLARDTDPFNRWQAGQSLALRLIRAGGPAEAFAEALGLLLDAEAPRDPAFAALMLSLPGEGEVANEIEAEVDPDAIHGARKALRAALGRALRDRLEDIEARLAEPVGTPYSPDAAAAGRRALRNAALDLLAAGDPQAGAARAAARLEAATNMTDRLAALGTLALIPGDAREAALAAFGARYADEPLVLDKWFALQATIPEPGTPERIEGLKRHPAYALTNPNRVRALVGSFAFGNPTQFTREDGTGFALVADTVAALDGANPQAAARLLTAFGSWRKLKKSRAVKAEEMLNRIKAIPGLSRDVADIVTRTLAPVNQL